MLPAVSKLSIVCPAYEEEAVLPSFHAELGAVLHGLEADYDIEVLYVDDGSHDGAAAVVESYMAPDRKRPAEGAVRLLRHSQNRGYGAALKTGLAEDVVGFDMDLEGKPGATRVA